MIKTSPEYCEVSIYTFIDKVDFTSLKVFLGDYYVYFRLVYFYEINF